MNFKQLYNDLNSWCISKTNFNLRSYLRLIGLGTLGYAFYSLLQNAKLLVPHDLSQRYGRDSWAIVTGASDGIGRAFCEELTKDGFNIILIARTRSKLEATVKRLKEIRKDVKTKIILADFSNGDQPGFYEDLLNELDDYDISLLINNVGMETMDCFENIDLMFLKDLIVVNTLAVVTLTKFIISRAKDRKYHSGIINIASLSSVRPLPYFSTYAASKRFTHIFTKAVAREYKDSDKLDILSCQPGYVTTNMTAQKKSFETIPPNRAARIYLNRLGRTDHAIGYYIHKMTEFTLKCPLPNFALRFTLKKEMNRRKKYHGHEIIL